MSTIDERVAAGAAWLDEHRPGWVDRIDLETLDLGSDCRCILGQEHGDFWRTPEFEPLDRPEVDDMAEPLGLLIGLWTEDGYNYDDLTDAWCALITARREQSAVTG